MWRDQKDGRRHPITLSKLPPIIVQVSCFCFFSFIPLLFLSQFFLFTLWQINFSADSSNALNPINYMHMHSTMQSNREPSIPYIWGFSVLQIFGISHLRESHPPCIFSLPDQLIERQRSYGSKSILLRVIWPESLLSNCFGSCSGLEVHPWTKFRSNQQYHRRRSRSRSCRH